MLKNWIQNVVVFLFLMSLVGQLVPEEKYRKYVRLTMGFILILVMFIPVSQVFGMDEKVFDNFIQSQMDMAIADVKSSGQTMDMQRMYMETYKEMVIEEVETYFELEAAEVDYCHIEMETNVESSSYGKLYEMCVGIHLKGNASEENRDAIEVAPVLIGKDREHKEESFVPKEKINKWKQDLTMQFGLNEDQLVMEIVS